MNRGFHAIVIVLLAAASSAAALSPQEVLVVVNSRSKESVELGSYYCRQRGVPPTNLVPLEVSEGGLLSDQEYRQQVLQPLRQVLGKRPADAPIRCIVLMRGIPWRIDARTPSAAQKLRTDWAQRVQQRAQGQLATDVELLKLVGSNFPEKALRAASIEKVGDFFQAAPVLPETLPAVENLVEQAQRLLTEKTTLAANLTDPTQKAIAQRQVLALIFEMHGLTGLAQAAQRGELPAGYDPGQLGRQIAELAAQTQALLAAQATEQSLATLEKTLRMGSGSLGLLQTAREQGLTYKHAADRVALDSELALLWWDDGHDRFLPNPLNWRKRMREAQAASTDTSPATRPATPPVVMTARIDGPDWPTCRRMIDDSLATEQTGLAGKLYVDAGGMHPWYDVHLRRLAQLVREQTHVPVVLDERQQVFEPNTCPQAALYVGWYSLQHYVPAFAWSRGAVGYHLGSYEAIHLGDANTTEWVPSMLRAGAAASVGPTDEPYLHAFPLPEEFFGMLLSGKLTLAEVYWLTVPHVGWRMLLVGDPLYTPYKANPQLPLPAELTP